MALLHGNATARDLGLLRIWVFGIWIADLCKDPITRVAAIPFEYFRPVGVLRLIPIGAWNAMQSADVLGIWWATLVMLLILAALGTRFYHAIAGLACVLLTVYQGVLFGYSEVSHAELAALYVAYLLAIFPSADGLSLGPVRRTVWPGVYPAAILTATIVFLSTYMLVAVRRLAAGGVAIFFNGSILRSIADRAATPDHFEHAYGLWVLQFPVLATTIEVAFVAVTICELLSLVCLWSPRFRRLWLAVMLPFHLVSWPLIQTLFLHNILLMFVLLFDVDWLDWISGSLARAGVPSSKSSATPARATPLKASDEK